MAQIVIDLGSYKSSSSSKAIQLRMINAYTLSSGEVFFYLDANGNNVADDGDAVNHDVLDHLFNNGIDTNAISFDSRAASYLNQNFLLPTVAEYINLFNIKLAVDKSVRSYGYGHGYPWTTYLAPQG